MKVSEYTPAPFFPLELLAIMKAAKAWCKIQHFEPPVFGGNGMVRYNEEFTTRQSMTYLEFSKMYSAEFSKVKNEYPHQFQFSSKELETSYANWLEICELDDSLTPLELLQCEELTHLEYCTIEWYITFLENVIYLEENPPVEPSEEDEDVELNNFIQQLTTR